MPNNNDLVVCHLMVFGLTDKAYLLGTPKSKAHNREWLPYSLATFHWKSDQDPDSPVNQIVECEMPRWLAEKKDFPYKD